MSKMKNLNELSKKITELIDEGLTDISVNIGDLHIPVKSKDKIAIELLLQLLEHPEIETVCDVNEVLQDAIVWHHLFYIIKHSDEKNAQNTDILHVSASHGEL